MVLPALLAQAGSAEELYMGKSYLSLRDSSNAAPADFTLAVLLPFQKKI